MSIKPSRPCPDPASCDIFPLCRCPVDYERKPLAADPSHLRAVPHAQHQRECMAITGGASVLFPRTGYLVKLRPQVAQALEEYAASTQGQPETVAAEIIAAFLGGL
ncbi:MAG TPA: hypothetical protein VKT73_12895 [Xanthobacteraceae bacterium]|nr:hypothetical protein [Xanthobacteraceae bacterium]